ncbi:MAG TPA: hypothetical protein VGB54_11085 [Allosphingosinicella sp.]|jgi:ribosomal protein L37AE/L43A
MKARSAHTEAAAAKCPACEGWGIDRAASRLTLCSSCGGSGRPAQSAAAPAPQLNIVENGNG